MSMKKSNPSELDRIITEKEAQKLLNLSRQTLFRKRKSGELHYYQCGKKVLYSPKHIEDFLSNCEE